MLSSFPFDPVLRSQEVEKIVMDNAISRMYYKFKYMDFYGGINTAYANGCGLLCGYCFNYARNSDPRHAKATFYKPSEIVKKLRALADSNDCQVCRVSGCEPILGDRSTLHLITIIKSMPGFRFVIESNGLSLGADPTLINYFDELKDRSILFRICLKASDPVTFERVTGSKPDFWELPVKGLKALISKGFDVGLGYMPKYCNPAKLGFTDSEILDPENVHYYPGTKARMIERGIDQHRR